MVKANLSPEAEAMLAKLISEGSIPAADLLTPAKKGPGRPAGSKNKPKSPNGPTKLVDGTEVKYTPLPKTTIDTENLSKIWIIERPFQKSTDLASGGQEIGTVWQFISAFATELGCDNAMRVCSKLCRKRMILVYGKPNEQEQKLSESESDAVRSGFPRPEV